MRTRRLRVHFRRGHNALPHGRRHSVEDILCAGDWDCGHCLELFGRQLYKLRLQQIEHVVFINLQVRHRNLAAQTLSLDLLK